MDNPVYNQKQEVKIVEKIVIERRPWYAECLEMLVIIVIVTGVVWAVSKADDAISNPIVEPSSPFSAIGTVSVVSYTSLILDDANGSDGTTDTTYTFDVTNVKRIENNEYDMLSLGDIAVGDRVIVQGTPAGGTIIANRIISFGAPTNIATSTPITDDTASSTISTSTDTTTEQTGTTTPQSDQSASTTDETASSTEATTTNDSISTTTDQSAKTDASSTPDSLQDGVQNIIDNITGNNN